MEKEKVLLLCTGNACRSQMAEGLVRDRLGQWIKAYSAGTHPSGVHPMAARALKAAGIDPSRQCSKHVHELGHIQFDLVVTLCSYADRECPVISNTKKRHHMPFEDPIHAIGSEEEVLSEFCRVRDQIDGQLIPFLKEHFGIKT